MRLDFLVPAVLLLAACGRDHRAAESAEAAQIVMPAAAPAPMASVAGGLAAPPILRLADKREYVATAAHDESAAAAFAPVNGQKLIRTAELRIRVSSVDRAIHDADSTVKSLGALVADARQASDQRGAHDAQMVLRVPAARFDSVLASLRRLGDVTADIVNAQDITREYADLDIRIGVKEETVARLRSLLANRTAKLADVLQVERELARAVTELEQMKGERRFDDQQVALSSVTVHFYEREVAHGVTLAGALGESFRSGVGTLQASVAWLVYVGTFLAPWIVLLIMGWTFRGRLRRRSVVA